MRISRYYKLGLTQPSLEFVDVDIRADTPVFVDPRALHSIDSDWGNECVSLLQSFFAAVLDAIQKGGHAHARELLASLREPNETRLGLSAGQAQGRGMGRDLARDTWEALRTSRAVSTGLLEDLEDTILFIGGIGFDIISDITTNIIRGPLIQFTNDACTYHGIKVVSGIASGHLWDHRSRDWTNRFVSLPMAKHGPLLLVPKGIVRRSQTFNPGEYYNHYVLPYLQSEELRAGSSLVEVLKGGNRRVTKKAVKKKYGTGKRVNLETTLKDASILDRYRQSKARPQMPPSHYELAALTSTPEPDWNGLLQSVLDVAPGNDAASQYHRAIEALLSALFYPALDFPKREHRSTTGGSGSTLATPTWRHGVSSIGSMPPTAPQPASYRSNARTTRQKSITRQSTNLRCGSRRAEDSWGSSVTGAMATRDALYDGVATLQSTAMVTSSP